MATIERRGPSQFRATVRRKGLEPQRRTFATRQLADAWARSIESKIDTGEPFLAPEAARTTLAEALDRYAREITPHKRGARQEASRIAQWRRHALAQRPLAAIRGVDLAQYRDERLQAVGAATVRLELAIISHLYKIARTDWGMEALRAPVVRKPATPAPRERRLAPGEFERLQAEADPELRAALVLAVETAMRRGELAGLQRQQIDRARRVVSLHTTKNGHPRHVPLSPAALVALEALPARVDGRIFAPGVEDRMTRGFARLCKRLGIEGLRWHDLRREAISRLFERGFSIADVREVSGHRTLSQLATYTRGRAEEIAKRLAA